MAKGFVGVTTLRPNRQNMLDVSSKEAERFSLSPPPAGAVGESLCLVEIDRFTYEFLLLKLAYEYVFLFFEKKLKFYC